MAYIKEKYVIEKPIDRLNTRRIAVVDFEEVSIDEFDIKPDRVMCKVYHTDDKKACCMVNNIKRGHWVDLGELVATREDYEKIKRLQNILKLKRDTEEL